MMSQPVLVCQGFQRAFIEPGSPLYSASASLRRTACEQLLRLARTSGWTVVHTFLENDAVRAAGEASIDGFNPRPTEPYFQQKGLSAFATHDFDRLLFPLDLSPIFLMSFAGVGPISATLLDGIERRLNISVVIDAVADAASTSVGENDRLAAIEVLARSCDAAVTSLELATLSPAPPPVAERRYLSQSRY